MVRMYVKSITLSLDRTARGSKRLILSFGYLRNRVVEQPAPRSPNPLLSPKSARIPPSM